MSGHYETFPSSVQLLKKHNFCTLDEFLSFINIYDYYGMYIHASYLATVRSNFIKLRKGAPFGRTIRFPDSFYIDMDCAMFRILIKQLLNTLFLLDFWKQKKEIDVGANKIEYINNVADARKSCEETFTKFDDIIMSTDIQHLAKNGIYCRETFENKYGLIWRLYAV